MNIKKISFCAFISLMMIVFSGCGSNTASNNETGSSDTNNELKKDAEKEDRRNSSKEDSPQISNVVLELKNETDFYVVTTAEGNGIRYAYYVIKDGEIYEKFPYEKEAHFSYTAEEPGEYKVRSFVKDKDGNKITKDTDTVNIQF